MHKPLHRHFLLPLLLLLPFSLLTAESQFGDITDTEAIDDGSYELTQRDLVEFRVHGEGDTHVQVRVDGNGGIRIPFLGTQEVAGLTIREAERHIERLYINADIFVNPQVSIRVHEYAGRSVSVLGQVARPGTIRFPIEAEAMPIISVISEAGGLTGIARSRRVRVTRINSDGEEEVHNVNLDRILRGSSRADFTVRPGDIIYVPERFF